MPSFYHRSWDQIPEGDGPMECQHLVTSNNGEDFDELILKKKGGWNLTIFRKKRIEKWKMSNRFCDMFEMWVNDSYLSNPLMGE